MEEDVRLMKNYTNLIRFYGITRCGQGLVMGKIAAELGMQLFIGVENGPDYPADNDWYGWEKITLVRMYEAFGLDNVVGYAVGCESILRQDQTIPYIIEKINDFRSVVRGLGYDTPVGTADIPGSFLTQPDVIAASDIVVLNIFAFWGGVAMSGQLNDTIATDNFFKSLYYVRDRLAPYNVSWIIGETGWPTDGGTVGGAVASVENQAVAMIQVNCRAWDEGIPLVWFQAFDQPSKDEGVEQFWGVWTDNRTAKASLATFKCKNYTYVPQYPDVTLSTHSNPFSSTTTMQIPTTMLDTIPTTSESDLETILDPTQSSQATSSTTQSSTKNSISRAIVSVDSCSESEVTNGDARLLPSLIAFATFSGMCLM
eukprot:TRINITY_DN10240_c0_g1_i1.p1 TRINITY_DN10240_c0_g1~~TRINITY_DN10240_c0_g1_i1.p1  ORF type:complete len:415 (+),score=48.05 TRINITY_DN10240_c0_g1_i1:136-1245(+)